MKELTPENSSFKARHGRRGALSGNTLKPPKYLVMNVWKMGPEMPKITPKAGKYLIP